MVKNNNYPKFKLRPDEPLPKKLRLAISLSTFIATLFVIGYLGYEDLAGVIMAFVSGIVIYFTV